MRTRKKSGFTVYNPSNNSLILWRFGKTEDGYYKIINRFCEEKSSPKMIYTPGNNSIRSTSGENRHYFLLGNKVKWNIIKSDANKDDITPRFYFTINEDGTSLHLAQSNCVNLDTIEKNEENNKAK